MKIAVIGAGSYTFGPSMLKQALCDHRLPGLELALMDVNPVAVETMAVLGRRMARELGQQVKISSHTDLATALDGVDFVTFAAVREGLKRFAVDLEIIHRLSPGHLISEFGGVAGISYSLRQIALVSELAKAMKKHCPQAWLLDSANPLPRVCQATHELGIHTAGFCAVSVVGLQMAWLILHDERLSYPFPKAAEALMVLTAGLNHFAWLLELKDRASGRDLLPQLRQKLEEGATSGNQNAEALARQTGFLLVPYDDHTQDFLPPLPGSQSKSSSFHGEPQEREQRLAALQAAARGTGPWDFIYAIECWEKPIAFAAAMATGQEIRLPALNLINAGGQISNLPRQVFVETPVTIGAGGPRAQSVLLPETVVPFCTRTAAVTDAIVRAALDRSRRKLQEALELDPTVVDKKAGGLALEACLQAHADILPKYA